MSRDAEVSRLNCSLKRLRDCPDDFAWEIKECPGMGRSCFATRTIEAGETLAYDEPLLYWEEEEPIDSSYSNQIIEACRGRIHNNVVNYLSAYASAPREVQARVDDFAHLATPEDGKYIAHMTRVWTRIAESIWSSSSSSSSSNTDLCDRFRSKSNIVDLLTRSHLNAHNFYTGHVMLEVASKFNHSCTPNSTYNKYLDASGRAYMRIFTIKRVLAGQQLFSTYIGGTDMLKSTRERRDQLMLNKAFYCRCARCRAPELLAPLPCPACLDGTLLRHDEVEWPWHCDACPRRWWDAQVTVRESQLRRLLLNLDGDMDAGRFPPLQIMHFLLRDTLLDLSPRHYLAIRARLLLDELYAFRAVTGVLQHEEVAGRIANAWVHVEFLMSVVWKVSPVVATNLAILRMRTLLGTEGHLPAGVPQHRLKSILLKSEAFLRSFWDEDDSDAALFRKALHNERICQGCQAEISTLVVCGSCASAHYCSRACRERERAAHEEACRLGCEVGTILHSTLAF